MITRIVKLTFKPEHVDRFQQMFSERGHLIRAFEGCEHVLLMRDSENPNVFFTLSEWRSAEHLEQYRNSEIFKDTWTRTKAFFDAPAEAWSLTDSGL